MRPAIFSTMLSFDDALKTVLGGAVPIERTETVPISEAGGRISATNIVSRIDVPPFDRAAMDGYAVVAEDTTDASRDRPRPLTRVDRLFTGQAPSRGITHGECIEIATGAPMPKGATAVVMVEETDHDDDAVRVFAAAAPGQHIGRRAADIAAGQTVIAAGDHLTPSRIGAIAAVGVTSVEVYARPSVAILSTGNEVVPPGQPLGAGDIYDINRFTLEAIVGQHGGVATPLPAAGDALEHLEAALAGVSMHDIAVFSGGSSVGGRDLMVDALTAAGEVIFHGIAVKPGKPTLFGRLGRTIVFGMPGNPTSCLSNAYMLLVPLLRRTARLPPWRPETMMLPLTRRIASVPDRHQFYTVRIVAGQAEPAFKGSGAITSMAGADGFIEIAAGVDGVDAGKTVKVTLF